MQLLLSLFMLLFFSCDFENQTDVKPNFQTEKNEKKELDELLINTEEQTLQERFNTPLGYERIKCLKESKGAFFRNLPLKKEGSPVFLFNHTPKVNQLAHAAVFDLNIGNKDLQQCADAVMRLHADYLFSQKKYEQIHFKFTNNFQADYRFWREGKRIAVKNNLCSWYQKSNPTDSYESYWNYLEIVFSYAGSLSLSKELIPIANWEEIQIGDVVIRGGSPGHAVTVMDVAMNTNGEKIFLLSQSYMPAQEIQLLKNPMNKKISPWYAVGEIEEELRTPEYIFYKNELMRFK